MLGRNVSTPYIIRNVITEYFHGIKILTTSDTSFEECEDIEVDWTKHTTTPTDFKLCCPTVESVRIDSFYKCKGCNRKIVPFPGEQKVTCQNALCKRKMLITRCKQAKSIEITFSEKGNETKILVLTEFPETLKHMIDVVTATDEEIEDFVLAAENMDINYNNKKVVTQFSNHQ